MSKQLALCRQGILGKVDGYDEEKEVWYGAKWINGDPWQSKEPIFLVIEEGRLKEDMNRGE